MLLLQSKKVKNIVVLDGKNGLRTNVLRYDIENVGTSEDFVDDELELLITSWWGLLNEAPDVLLKSHMTTMEDAESEMFIDSEQYIFLAWCKVMLGQDPSIPLLKAAKRLLESNFKPFQKYTNASESARTPSSERMKQFLLTKELFTNMFESGISDSRNDDVNRIDQNGSITYDLDHLIDTLHHTDRSLFRKIYSPYRGYYISSGEFLEDILSFAKLYVEHAGGGVAVPKEKLHLFEPKYMSQNKNVI